MRKIKNNTKDGFTLIELIIAIAILAIVSIAFLTMFSTSLIGISSAGKKSAAHYFAQNQMESTISDSTAVPTGVATNDTSITLNFSGASYTINGRKVDVTYTYGSQSKKLTSFTTK